MTNEIYLSKKLNDLQRNRPSDGELPGGGSEVYEEAIQTDFCPADTTWPWQQTHQQVVDCRVSSIRSFSLKKDLTGCKKLRNREKWNNDWWWFYFYFLFAIRS